MTGKKGKQDVLAGRLTTSWKMDILFTVYQTKLIGQILTILKIKETLMDKFIKTY